MQDVLLGILIGVLGTLAFQRRGNRSDRKTTNQLLSEGKRCAAIEFGCNNEARSGKLYCEDHYYFEEVRK